MRASAILLALFLAAGLAAQEASTPPDTGGPDFSRPTLLRLFEDQREQDVRRSDVRFHVGAVEFRSMGSNWRFAYLPLLAPLSGSRLGTTQEWPDPFLLTRTPIASQPRTWQTRREIERELRRIRKSKVRVSVSGASGN